MTDIVERLRNPPHAHAGTQGTKLDPYLVPQIMREAANEIERLREAVQRIDGINDNPAIYNPDIEAVVRAAIEKSPPAPCHRKDWTG